MPGRNIFVFENGALFGMTQPVVKEGGLWGDKMNYKTAEYINNRMKAAKKIIYSDNESRKLTRKAGVRVCS